ncbi:unnamed protein product [Phytomonas sp. EM1]|nr:unnamed protein product [Phytomonas sp. EM1]|eukprot:CCW64455.1 unnamed protein product [Phytomonas sp. isolate EM1]
MIECDPIGHQQKSMLERTVSLMHLVSLSDSIEDASEDMNMSRQSAGSRFGVYSECSYTPMSNSVASQKDLGVDLFLESPQHQLFLQSVSVNNSFPENPINKQQSISVKDSIEYKEPLVSSALLPSPPRIVDIGHISAEPSTLIHEDLEESSPGDSKPIETESRRMNVLEVTNPVPHDQDREQNSMMFQITKGGVNADIPPVARGPQPPCVEPTRYRNGERIRPAAPARTITTTDPSKPSGSGAQTNPRKGSITGPLHPQLIGAPINYPGVASRNGERINEVLRNKIGNNVCPTNFGMPWGVRRGRLDRVQYGQARPPPFSIQPQPKPQTQTQPPPLQPGALGTGSRPTTNDASGAQRKVECSRKKKAIRTTVGNDSSWLKDLVYTTWVDTPKASNAKGGQKQLSKTTRMEPAIQKSVKMNFFKTVCSFFSNKKST